MTKSKPHRIVMVDDERTAMKYYRQALELAGYDVQFCNSVDELKPLLSAKQILQVDLFIIDIMQPPGEMYADKQTDDGLYTGLFLAQDIRKAYRNKPVILLSNVTFPSVREAAERLESRLSNCIVLTKLATPPLELANVVNRYFEDFELQPRKRRSILRRLFDSLLLQPNVSGVGIDLKKLGEDEQ